ncbi:MAG: UDP-N-acetylglucosamine--LPS N-acetylglucosamine transferase [Planctomycetota bacterium]
MKIALVASAGGHMSELLLLEEAWKGHEHFFITTGEMVAEELAGRYGSRVYVLGEANRRQPLRMLRALWRCAGAMLRERPDAVLSLGAACGCLAGLIGKATGAKLAWVDSIANVEQASLSGRIARPFADLFLVQWPGVAERCRGAEYRGELL